MPLRLGLPCLPLAVLAAGPAAAAGPDAFAARVKPFLAAHCTGCHHAGKASGGVALDQFGTAADARKARKTWEAVRRAVAAGDMPPGYKPRPPAADTGFVLAWIAAELTRVDCGVRQDPGRVTLRRLNRAEYNNTVRDLCGVDVRPADEFPADDVGYGFDNIGDVLSVQPLLVEKYLAAADRVLDAALTARPVRSARRRFGPHDLLVTPTAAKKLGGQVRIELTSSGAAYLRDWYFPADGEYAVRAGVWGRAAGGQAPVARLAADRREVGRGPAAAPADRPVVVEGKLRVAAGDRPVAVAFANPDKAADPPRLLGVSWLEVEGPLGGAVGEPPGAARILVADPAKVGDRPAAERILGAFARRAYRRPVRPGEVADLVKLYDLARQSGDDFHAALRLPLRAVLVSPHFLFRVEDDPADPAATRPLSAHELAARLSYFLWASMPDAELTAAADAGLLADPAGLRSQVKRMLADPSARALVDNFVAQWLGLRTLTVAAPDPARFPAFDEPLRQAMIRETELFAEHVIRTDRPVTDFLDAGYTFANGRLAEHYGLGGVTGPDFRMVKLADRRRGGVLTHASVLTVTSTPSRTSPVKRGKWVYENILGLTAPPPAPDVPELPSAAGIKGTIRQQYERHRADPACAACHAKLDPLGFGLEHFDAVGAWREADNGHRVDASGVLPDGAAFADGYGLRRVLLAKADQFRRCLAEKLLTFALGRGLEYYDKCAVDEVVAKLKAGGDRFSALAVAVTETAAFRSRAGRRGD